ncbi:MAG TPA: 16S rRNA (guanine(527)-N(7))-methyltransferase RsmG [Gammaproteobacteria bacterium]|nr:16S rRNA (guanine(527)-N(7))-methyltransferase RsmG [Gammaproteobacteria bacterium]
MDLGRSLDEGLAALGLDLPVPVRERLLDYVALLAKWNRVYNLTAVRRPEQMIARHLLDSLAVLPYLRPTRILDVGSGAGLPGIPLALAREDCSFVLLDSNRKKTRFMTQAAAELGLENVEVVTARIADYRPATPFDTIVSRAYASLDELVSAACGACAPDGVFLIMKGVYPLAELDALPAGFAVEGVHRLHVPGLDAERHVVVVRPT